MAKLKGNIGSLVKGAAKEDLHLLLADTVMDQGSAGNYRTINVQVGKHLPPSHEDVSPLMFELLEWWNTQSLKLSPILSSVSVFKLAI